MEYEKRPKLKEKINWPEKLCFFRNGFGIHWMPTHWTSGFYKFLLLYYGHIFGQRQIRGNKKQGNFHLKTIHYTLVTQPMLQLRLNQTELRLMIFKSIFNVDSKNVNKMFLHRHSWKKVFFFQNLPWGTKGKNLKKIIFLGVTVEELFVNIFGIYIKNWFRNHQS